METKIIMDSCVDFNDTAFDPAQEYARIPFKINIDGEEIVDRNLNTFLLVDKMKLSKHKMTTSCPSPKEYLDAIDPNKINYIVTISGKLSGSYNSAVMAQKMAAEEGISENVHVFDSQSAVTGEDLIVMKINELVARGLPPIDLVPIVRDYITNMTTFFILQSLDNLAKNGRLRPAVALIGKMLKIVPIMNGNQGEIELKDKVRGRKKAFQRLVGDHHHRSRGCRRTHPGHHPCARPGPGRRPEEDPAGNKDVQGYRRLRSRRPQHLLRRQRRHRGILLSIHLLTNIKEPHSDYGMRLF